MYITDLSCNKECPLVFLYNRSYTDCCWFRGWVSTIMYLKLPQHLQWTIKKSSWN